MYVDDIFLFWVVFTAHTGPDKNTKMWAFFLFFHFFFTIFCVSVCLLCCCVCVLTAYPRAKTISISSKWEKIIRCHHKIDWRIVQEHYIQYRFRIVDYMQGKECHISWAKGWETKRKHAQKIKNLKREKKLYRKAIDNQYENEACESYTLRKQNKIKKSFFHFFVCIINEFYSNNSIFGFSLRNTYSILINQLRFLFFFTI